ncbi:MAG: hypothetical protein WA397_13120 [Roseiarcus sp.]
MTNDPIPALEQAHAALQNRTALAGELKAAAADVRRADHGISQMMAGGSPVSARDFK